MRHLVPDCCAEIESYRIEIFYVNESRNSTEQGHVPVLQLLKPRGVRNEVDLPPVRDRHHYKARLTSIRRFTWTMNKLLIGAALSSMGTDKQ